MNKIVVAFSAVLFGLLGLAGTASASTFSLSFTGNVTYAIDTVTNDIAPGYEGKSVSGQLVFDGNSSTNTSPNSEQTNYDHASWSFKVDSDPTYTHSANLGYISLDSNYNGGIQAIFGIGPGPADIELRLYWNPTAQLASLATFPANTTAAAALFGGAFSSIAGADHAGQKILYMFDITSFTASTVAPTPLPAAIWFFISALGGLGWFARRRALEAMPAAA
jgi:hypothetical protein